MKDFFKKHKISILASSIVILIGCFFYVGIFRLVKNIRFSADEVQRKVIDSEIDQRNLAKMPQIQKASAELKENEKKLTGILREEDEVDFIKKIEVLAEETQNKIDLKIIDEGRKEDGKTKTKNESGIKLPNNDYISLQANLSGNYANLYNFIKKIENFEYYVNIISINSKLEEDKTITIAQSEVPVINLNGTNQTATAPEAKPKFLLKTQINFIAYIIK